MRLQHPKLSLVRIGFDEHIEQRRGILELALSKHAASETESPLEIVWLKQQRIAIRRLGWLIVLLRRMREPEQTVRVRVSTSEFNHAIKRSDCCREIRLSHADETDVAIRPSKRREFRDGILETHQRIIKPILLKQRAAEREVEDR